MPRAEIKAARRGGGAAPADRPHPRPLGLRPRRRRPPARRARPRHRAPAEGVSDGRAARHARRRVPRPHGARAARAAQPHRRDHRLRHPRPARGDGDGRQDRRDEPRRDRAVRHAAGDLRPAGLDVRRRFHRLAADELPAGPCRRSRRARAACASTARRSPCRRCARTCRRPSSRSASAPSTSASTMPRRSAARSSAPNISAPRRSSPSPPSTGRSRRGCRRACRCAAARRSASPSAASGCRSSTRRAAARIRTALHEGRRAWLRSRSPASPSASARRSRSIALDLAIADGEFVVLLGPTGAGKTTTLRLVAGLERPDAGRDPIGGRDVTRAEPAARDVTFVFQQYSLYPHLSVFDNLAFPLRSPARRVPEAEIRRRVERGRRDAAHRRTSCRTARRSSPAARCSASRSAARWCAGPPST